MRRNTLRTTAAAALLAAVALPASAQTVVDVLMEQPGLSRFARIVERSGLGPELSAPGAFTVFAPTDRSFDSIPLAQLNRVGPQASRADLQSFVRSHVTSHQAPIFYQGGWNARTDTSIGGTPVRLMREPIRMAGENEATLARVTANGRQLVGEVRGSNGRVHFVDGLWE